MNTIRKKISEGIFPILSGIFTYFFFGTAEMYLSNKNEFWFSYSDMLLVLVAVSILTLFLCMVIILVIPNKVFSYAVSILYGMVIALYIQGNFLPNNYGELDGTAIDWSMYKESFVINIAVWCLFVFGCFFAVWRYKEKVLYYYKIIIGIIVATQVVTLLTIVITQPKNENESIVLTTNGEFEVSSNDNTLVFILDCFDAEVLYELLQKYPSEIKSAFADFTFYRDTVGGATRTKFAIPYILSGYAKTENNSYIEYLEASTKNSSFIQEIKSNKYDVRMYTNLVYLAPSLKEIVANIKTGEEVPTSELGLTKDFLKLTAFRYVPEVFKQYFWLYSGDFSNWKATEGLELYKGNDIAFYNTLCSEGLKCTTEEPAFRLYHLNGAHPPYTMDENCEKIEIKNGSEEKQAIGALKIVSEFISQLKELNVYDNATIFIIADHGGRGLEQNPLFMVKQSEQRQEFQQSDTPIWFKDLPDMFVDSLTKVNIDFEEEYQRQGKRYFYVGNSSDIITEYVTNGVAYDRDSFKPTGNSFLGYEEKMTYSYQLGEKLFFTQKATGNGYCISGLSKNEGTHTWTDGTEMLMRFEVNENFDSLKLQMEYYTYTNSQHVIIYVNDNKVAEYMANGREKKEVVIPGEYIKDSVIDLRFEFSCATSPYERGVGSDKRKLGLAMESLTLLATEENFNETEQLGVFNYRLGTELLFTENDTSGTRYCIKGFSHNETNFTWTNATKAEMKFNIKDEYADLCINLEYDIFTNSQRIIVYANKHEVANYIATEGEVKQIIVPKEYITDGSLVLSFELPDAVSPEELGVNKDSRTLALAMKSLTITSVEEIKN